MEELPEFKRESTGGFPWAGLVVITLLILVGVGLLGFAVYAGQRETESRAIEGTVSVVLSFTSTSTQTRVPTDTPTVTLTPTVTETPNITQTPTSAPTLTGTPTVTKTKKSTARPVQPTDTPVPPPPPTSAPVSKHGISGQLTLCNPEKQSFAAAIERICFRELVVNNTSAPVSYGVLGVQATNLSGGSDKFQTSWRGDLSVPANGTGPTGGGWEDGIYIDAPGTYRLTLSICYSDVNTCLGNNGEWEALTSGVNVNVVNWTP